MYNISRSTKIYEKGLSMTLNTNIQTINWKPISLSDRELFENHGNNSDGIAMFGFASLFFWKSYYKTSFALINGNIVCRGLSDSGNCVIYFPRGLNNEISDTVNKIIDCSECKVKFLPLTESTANIIKEAIPQASVKLLDGKCEYVYNQSDLALLVGKKYHAKRNHIAKFDKNYDYEYIPVTENNLDMLAECAEHLFNKIENSPREEYTAIQTAIEHFKELELRAAIIKVDGKYVAYSIGSSINENTADIHFEKADRDFEGSYAKINNCFAKNAFGDKLFLNREEDLGIEGLRKAKLSYYPCKLNQMYSVELF